MVNIVGDVKLGSGKDSIREVWFTVNGENSSILLRGSNCHDKDINDIIIHIESMVNIISKRKTKEIIDGRLRKTRKIK